MLGVCTKNCMKFKCIIFLQNSSLYKCAWKTRLQCWLRFTSSSSSIGTTACCRLWPVEQCCSILSCLSPTLSIFSFLTLEDLFLLPLSILSWVSLFVSSLPVLELRSFWASCPPFSPCDLTSLPYAPISILLYFLLCSSVLVLDSSYFSIPRFHI